MSEYIDKIKNSGISSEEIEEFESTIEITMNHMFDEYNFEPQNKNGLINAIQHMMFRIIVSHSEELNDDIDTKFKYFYSDFDNPKSSLAMGSLQVLLGSAMGLNFEAEYVNEDIRYLSSLIMERNHSSA